MIISTVETPRRFRNVRDKTLRRLAGASGPETGSFCGSLDNQPPALGKSN
jgi:hypothetical protein